ncbi:MAG: hypothetical protein KGY65_07310 [Candidatus Thermoplasmatota archaeon]|nr:hypothetical protein [Candidatus Thermoplasmatota archaeon]
MYFFLLTYSILGAGIKFIDAAYDEKTFSKKLALLLAPFLGGLWAYTMFINPFSATILLSILLGVILKGKIDNIAHFSGVIIIIPVILILGIELLIVPLLFLAAAALLDELGNDYVGDSYDKVSRNPVSRFFVYFFDHRWLLKITVLFLSVIGMIPLQFFFAMIFFDYSYLTIRYISEVRQGKRPGFDRFEYKVKSILAQKKIVKD